MKKSSIEDRSLPIISIICVLFWCNNTFFTGIRLLDDEPFREDGGFKCLNKLVENDLAIVIEVINENLYSVG